MAEFNNGCLNLVNKLNSFNNPGNFLTKRSPQFIQIHRIFKI